MKKLAVLQSAPLVEALMRRLEEMGVEDDGSGEARVAAIRGQVQADAP